MHGNIVRHVRDRDIKACSAVLHRLSKYRVIEITRIFTVDRDEGLVAQIDPIDLVAFLDLGTEIDDLDFDILRPFVRNVIGLHGDVDFHAGRHMSTQNVFDPTNRLFTKFRLFDDLNQHDVAIFSVGNIFGWDQNILANTLVFGGYETKVAFPAEPTNQLGRTTFNHLSDDRLNSATLIFIAFAG